MKFYVNAMARSLREISSKLLDHTDVIVEHIIKLVLMPDHTARNHWKKEIAMQINSIDTLKGSNKLPSSEQIYKWTYKEVEYNINSIKWMSEAIDEIKYDYNISVGMTPEEVCNAVDKVCSEYFGWLADYLSQSGRVASYKIYNKLDELV